MRIGMILDTDFPPDPRVENEALALINEGHQVHLFCMDFTGNPKGKNTLKGISIHRHKIPRHFYKFSALAYTFPYYHLALKGKLSRFIEANRIQALHIHDIQIARSVFLANRKLNLPVILDLHENRPEIMKYYSHVNSFPGKIFIKPSVWKRFEYRFIKEAHKVVVVTPEAAQHYVRKVAVEENKFYVVPNSVREEFYTNYVTDEKILTRYNDKFTLLYLGNTGLRRGLETAIEALRFIIPAIPEIKLVIVGKSTTDNVLKNRAADSGCENYVDFEGWKQPELFQSYIIAADAGICPLHKNLHHDTTYANKIFQYMAFSKPVIVSNCTAQEAVINKYRCGMVFQERDAKDYAKKVITLYRNKELRQEMGENAGRAIKEDLGWHKVSGELIRLYNELS